MAHHVFISYAAEDKTAAEQLCARLEKEGLICWIAPRDIPTGKTYASAIVAAIRSAAHFILVFSRHANSSRHVANEVERAFSKELPIHPLRLEQIDVGEELEYFLSRPQWFDLFGAPLSQRIDEFVSRFTPAVRPQTAVRPLPDDDLRKLEEGQGRVADLTARPDAHAAENTELKRLFSRARTPAPGAFELPGSPSSKRVSIEPAGIFDPLGNRLTPATFRSRMTSTPSSAATTPAAPAAVSPPAPSATPAAKHASHGPLVGKVVHYYDQLGVAGVQVVEVIRVGDFLEFDGSGKTVAQLVETIELDRRSVKEVGAGQRAGLKVTHPVDKGDRIFRLDVAKYLEERQEALGLRPAENEELIGLVDHYWSGAGAMSIVLRPGCRLEKGGELRIRGRANKIEKTINSLQRDRKPVNSVTGPALVGIGIASRVHAGNLVYRLRTKG